MKKNALSWSVAAALVLTACGGGDNDTSDAPAAPPPGSTVPEAPPPPVPQPPGTPGNPNTPSPPAPQPPGTPGNPNTPSPPAPQPPGNPPSPPPVVSSPLEISSTSYPDGGEIPLVHAFTQQGGANLSPQLTIRAMPAETKALAIVMDDEVAPCGVGDNACVHWNVFNLPADKADIAQGENLALIAGVWQGTTIIGPRGYVGPNPPNRHTYKLTVYALSEKLSTPPARDSYTRSQFMSAYGSKVIKQQTWTGHFSPRR